MTTKQPSSPHSGRPRRPRRPSGSRPRRFEGPKPPVAIPFDIAPHDSTPIEFAALDLDDRLRAGIEDRGFERTTPVQSAVFPIVFAGGDLIACAETGTGKTAAFLLPLMQRLLKTPTSGVIRGLVLAPTRELAVQIEDDFTGFAYHSTLTSVAVYGGVDGDIQARALKAGADMVVATPGRLLDHMSTGIVDFSKVEVLILDEADRMLDMGFWPDVSRIVASLPAERQTLLFSATTSSDVVKLAEQVMRDPKLIQIGRAGGPATTISHVAHVLPAGDKADWLASFLRRNWQPTLVFVRTKRFADRRPHSRDEGFAAPRYTRTGRRRTGRRRSRDSGQGGTRCSSPPTSPRAASTSTASSTSSTTRSRTAPTSTCTGPDGRAAPRRREPR